MRTLHVIRHAELALTGVLLGRTDPPLSDAGRAACLALDVAADLFYSSPLRRTRESADLIARGRPVRIDANLIEIALFPCAPCTS